ncbi:MAG: PIN domain-containing protein [Deltaproteobacteria bacterium]|nr:MAG: PIN domain-containing protein [Deltaproteobacteria bacterium]
MNGTEKDRSFLLDTSALLAYWFDEKGADEVERILRTGSLAKKIYISFMTVMEAKYQLWRHAGKEAAEEFERIVRNLPITRLDVTDPILNRASEIKASARLSVADSWIIATAIESGSTLVHKDPEFEQVKDRVSLISLPYKK